MTETIINTTPAAGLWHIPQGWARIDLSVPRLFGSAFHATARLKEGLIAIADDPAHSTGHFSVDGRSVRTGNAAVDDYLQHEVLDVDRYSTIPVRIAAVKHCGGQHWTADGWITIRGMGIPIQLAITCDGIFRNGLAALFRAETTLPLREVLPDVTGLRSRLIATKTLKIDIEIYAEPVRSHQVRTARRSSRQLLSV